MQFTRRKALNRDDGRAQVPRLSAQDPLARVVVRSWPNSIGGSSQRTTLSHSTLGQFDRNLFVDGEEKKRRKEEPSASDSKIEPDELRPPSSLRSQHSRSRCS